LSIGGDEAARERWGDRANALDAYNQRMRQAAVQYGPAGPAALVASDFVQGVQRNASDFADAGERRDYVAQGRATFRLTGDAAAVTGVAGAARFAVTRVAVAEGRAASIVVEGDGLDPGVRFNDTEGEFAPISQPSTDSPLLLGAESRVRLPQDIAVSRNAPPAKSPQGRGIGTSTWQNNALQKDISEANAMGATDIRVDQQQVTAAGDRVGTNRPDLQYTRPDGTRVYIEYDRATSGKFPNSPRGPQHMERILANDPNAVVILRTNRQ
jgi:hypothetical protein